MLFSRGRPWWMAGLAWVALSVGGAMWLAYRHLQVLEGEFATDARIVHRLLSQRAVQHDAIMAMLPLLQLPQVPASDEALALPRLPVAYPQILEMLRRLPSSVWPASWPQTLREQVQAAVDRSRDSGHAELAHVDFAAGTAWLVLANPLADFALQWDVRAAIPWEEWPMETANHPAHVRLDYQGQHLVVQAGEQVFPVQHLGFQKKLATPSQPFDVVMERGVRWSELPWLRMLMWSLFSAALVAALYAGWRQRVAARRSEELLRLGQVARLNQLGELAACMAHELNQPLTALLANTQAAQRLLGDEEPDLPTAQHAMGQAVDQARRASAVVGRLRRVVERPDLSEQTQPLALDVALHDALHLLEPEIRRRHIRVDVQAPADLPPVCAEPVAVQQVIHNLVMNALQAMEAVDASQRHLQLCLSPQGPQVMLSVRDSGPGVAEEARTRLFMPFYTTRAGGLGLGLSLSEGLVQAMGGQLKLAPSPPTGAQFLLYLPRTL